MAAIERPYTSLNKEALIRVLDHIPGDQVKLAIIYENVLTSRAQNPARLWEEKYKSHFKEDYPEHKVEWCLDVVDLIGRALVNAPEKELSEGEIEQIAEISGIFSKKYVNPDVKKLYDNSANWKTEKTYQDQIKRRYIGPGDLRRLVEDNSHFSREDLGSLIVTMEIAGNIKEFNNLIHIT
jgi:hypothetical protein